jgi:hypothetical protein
MVANSNCDRELQDAKCAEELGRGSAGPFRFAGLSSQVAVVYLRNDCVPSKSDFAPLASEKNKIATCGRFRHRWAARNDDIGTAFEVPAGLHWPLRLFAVVAERQLRQSFNL